MLYVSSRYKAMIYQVSPTGSMSVYVEGMGSPPAWPSTPKRTCTWGTAVQRHRHHLQDQSATSRSSSSPPLSPRSPPIIWPSGRTATCTSPDPPRRASIRSTTSRPRAKWRPLPGARAAAGDRFRCQGRLYVAASMMGRRGVVRIGGDQKAELFLSGPNIVGLAFSPSRSLIVATTNALYRVDVNIAGKPLT